MDRRPQRSCKRSDLAIRLLVAALLMAVAVRAADITAKKMAILNTANGKVADFQDSVTVTDGGTRITAGEVEFYDQQNMAIIHGGNVNIVTPTSQVSADSAQYLIGAKRTYLYGKVDMHQEGLEITGPSLVLDNNLNQVSADSGVRVVDSAQELDVTGKTGTFDLDSGTGTITGSPALKMGRDKPLEVHSRLMVLNRPQHYARAIDSVRGEAQGATVTADTLCYFLDQDSALATGSPKLSQGDNEVTGERMWFSLDSTDLRQIVVDGTDWHTRLTRKQDSISGRQIVINFDRSRLSTIDVLGDSDRQPEMHDLANRARGDSVRFYFRDDTMSLARAIGRSSGTFFTDGGDRIEVGGSESVISFRGGAARQVAITDVTDGKLFRHPAKDTTKAPKTKNPSPKLQTPN